MPKRKQDASSEEESCHSNSFHSDSEDAPIGSSNKTSNVKNTAKKTASSKKPKVDINEEPTVEKRSPVPVDNHSNDIKVLVNADGDKYIDLGKKKRAVVRSFKGIPLLDIREYYGTPGEEKPGKKGISLTLDQWKILNTEATTIDRLFSEQKKA